MISPSRIPSYIRRVYIHFGFPVSEWAARYRLDFRPGNVHGRAKRNYLSIAASISAPDSNGEQARLRYYGRKIDRARQAR